VKKMAKVDITIQEAKALQGLMQDAKVPVHMGYILGGLIIKIEQSIGKEQEKQLKSKFSKKESKVKKSDTDDED